MSDNVIKIGTRATALAVAQAREVADLIQREFPKITPELVYIKTSGDAQQLASLTSSENFFTKEIDFALQSGQTDVSVHSLKDTSTKRPDGIAQVAMLLREDPRDLLVCKKGLFTNAIAKRGEGTEIIIGTSSPRRQHLVPKFLREIMGISCKISTTEIRGSVETRLKKVGFEVGSEVGFECNATVLAAAGLNRLIGQNNLDVKELLQDKDIIVLPLSECPGAAGQGAIVVETLAESRFVEVLQRINHLPTYESCTRERAILRANGGGCHQKFGVYNFGSINDKGCQATIVCGLDSDNKDITQVLFDLPSELQNVLPGEVFDTADFRLLSTVQVPFVLPSQVEANVFIANAKAVCNAEVLELLKGKTVWVSGIESWIKLSKMGVLVSGCFEGMGREVAEGIFGGSFFQPSSFVTITSQEGAVEQDCSVATYSTVSAEISEEVVKKLLSCRVIFWKSTAHIKVLKPFLQRIKPSVVHLCVQGKTKKSLDALFSGVVAFANYSCYKQWKESLRSRYEG